MNTFEYELNDVIGIVDVLDNGNAAISVVGYVDSRGYYYKLSQQEIANLFPPKKLVFAHNVVGRYGYTFQDSLVRLSVLPNNKQGSGYYAFIWDKSQDIYEFGAKVVKLREELSENGQTNYAILSNYKLVDQEDDVFFSSGNKIYRIMGGGKERIIPYWNLSSLDIVNGPNEKLYVVNYDYPNPDGVTDITNDEQLIDWYLRKVLKPNWKEIIADHTFKKIESYLHEALSSMSSLDSVVYKSRMDRLKNMNINFELTLSEIQEMAEFPWMESAIQKCVDKYQDHFLADFEKKCKDRLKLREDQLQEEIYEAEIRKEEYLKGVQELADKAENDYLDKAANLDKLISVKKQEIEDISNELVRKQEREKELEQVLSLAIQRKDSIVQDFTIIKEVLGLSDRTLNKVHVCESTSEKMFYEAEYKLTSNPVEVFEFFEASIERVFSANNIQKESARDIADLIAKYHVVLFPNVSLVNAVLIAMKCCRYLIEYVSVGWKSFQDLWDNGLFYIVEQCTKEPKLVHVLVLQNVNMSYMPNYLQPLIDLQNRLITRFPGTKILLPDNLRIFCTITEDELIPLAPNCIKYIGCVDKQCTAVKEYYDRIVPSKDNIGYLSADILTEKWQSIQTVPNYYKSYLNEDNR